MSNNPLLLLALIGVALYLAKGWWEDERAANPANPAGRVFKTRAITLAITGSLLLLGCETVGEYALGIVEEQSTITALFALYTLAAAFIEELIFRGYLVITGRGTAARRAGIFAASILFALLHPFLWEWEDAGFQLTLTLKGAFSTAVVLAASLWFYFLRFARCNPQHSLLPCIIAHMTKNLGVIGIKAAQGFLVGWF
ncbi:abortive infection protein [Cephaloticoccus capnophilus]|uniref:Abortive infection protein n=1 Tax=Cephaloticoccus capnophilus TaxID=1548208 RepID=A0A139SRC7_9BACT|nr:CPBP family intramembrane glutamic endopeptidase [Cephaloticoccus capnophilus]KXU37155.1 abortive infection protein [Cephaloticoccus capnophilus]